MISRISQVADKVGVSEATVSRVLNERPGVKAETRARILSALDALGYERPSKLRGERSRLVGLLIPDIMNPVFSAFAARLGSLLADQGIATVLCATQIEGGVTEESLLDLLMAHRVSGVIFTGGAYSSYRESYAMYDRLCERQLPTVVLNAVGGELPFRRVICDDKVAATLAWTHLRSLGHERIGMAVGAAGHVPSDIKVRTVRDLAVADGLELPDAWVRPTDYTLETGRAAGSALLREGVTAVITQSDVIALGVIRAATSAGRSVPEGLSVVGFDDSPLMASTYPPLTTVRMPVASMSQAAVAAIVGEMDGRPGILDEQVFDPELVVRGSTGPVPKT